MWFLNNLTSSGLRVLVTNFCCATFSYGMYLVLLWVGMYYLLASAVDFTIFIVLSFIINRHWSYGSSGPWPEQLAKYFLFYSHNQVIIMVGLYMLVQHYDFWPSLSQLAMQSLTGLFSVVVLPYIFRHRDT